MIRFCLLLLATVLNLCADIKSTSGQLKFFPDITKDYHALLNEEGMSIGNFIPSSNLHVKGEVQFESGNIYLGNTSQRSNVEIAGTFGQSFGLINTDTALSFNDNASLFLVDTSNGNIQITLPFAGNVTGRHYHFKKKSVENYFRITSSENIDGFDSHLDASAPKQGTSQIKLMSDGSEWYILDHSDDITSIIAADNLVGWYKLDETSGSIAFDSSGRNNHGTLAGDGATFSANNVIGRIDGGLNLSTFNNYIDITNFDGLPSSQLTVSCWAYITKHQNWTRFVNHEWVNNGWLLFAGANGDFRFGIGQSGTQHQANTPNQIAPLNQWMFITGTYDGNDIKIYINGSLIDTSPLVGAVIDNAGDVNISKSSSINGMLDDVRIYSRALTETEVLQLFREGL